MSKNTTLHNLDGMAKKKSHGGARAGAGRKQKPDKKQSRTVCLPPDVLAWLDAQPRGQRSKIIEAALRSYRSAGAISDHIMRFG